MNLKRLVLLAAAIIFPAGAALADNGRSAYTYIRESTGQVMVDSSLNGEIEARRNMPISTGDQIRTEDPARAEVALADGNILHVGGGTKVRFESLSDQQGTEDEVSEVTLSEGSIILSVVGSDEHSVPRIDTEDAAIYAGSGSRVRVNADVRRGTTVVVRAGSVEVRARSGSYTVRAGNYLIVQGDQEPEIARGSFSRDRFDLWAADRLEVTYETPSASGRYVGDDQYSGDVQALDGYGDWDYNSNYSSYVWRPNVAVGWSPYSNGSWYYTPVGLTWWSWDPWGWYPFHYGSWFWDVGWNSWCWSPGFVYSPAWCYWGYSGGYFGWCPIGYYNNWHGGHGWHGGDGGHGWNGGNGGHGWNGGNGSQGGPGMPGGGGNTRQVGYAINGRYATRNVDMRGWNFTNASNVGNVSGRLAVTPGTRLTGRLGDQIAVSSRPIVVDRASATGGARAALQEHIRQAPQTIERTASRDSQALAPVLARQQNLSRETMDALDRHTVVADRGRLSGPGAADIAPRGATIVDRGRGTTATDRSQVGSADRSGGRDTLDRAPSRDVERAQPRDRNNNLGDARTAPARPDASTQDWRGRSSRSAPDRSADSPRSMERVPAERSAPADSWRGHSRDSARDSSDQPARRQPVDRRGTGDEWRSRSEVPPARRVIEGAVPGRRYQGEPDSDRSPRTRNDASPYRGYPYRNREAGRPDSGGPRDYAPRSAPPRSMDRGPAPRSFDSSPAPRSAPPPQAAPAPRSAPAPHSAPSAPPSRGSGHSGRPGR